MSAVESFNESNRMASSKSTERAEIPLTFSRVVVWKGKCNESVFAAAF